MVLRVRSARAEDLDRVWELVMRTNQLNNLRARWGREVLEEYQSDANKLFCICELDDLSLIHIFRKDASMLIMKK